MLAYNLSKIILVLSEHKFLVLNGSIVNENVKYNDLSCLLLCIRVDMTFSKNLVFLFIKKM